MSAGHLSRHENFIILLDLMASLPRFGGKPKMNA